MVGWVARPDRRLLVACRLAFQEDAEQFRQGRQRLALVLGVQGDELGWVHDDALPLVAAPGSTGAIGLGVDTWVAAVLPWVGVRLRRRVLLSVGGCLVDNRPSGGLGCDRNSRPAFTNRRTVERWRANSCVVLAVWRSTSWERTVNSRAPAEAVVERSVTNTTVEPAPVLAPGDQSYSSRIAPPWRGSTGSLACGSLAASARLSVLPVSEAPRQRLAPW